ncbi:hypothetical protein BV898_04452 [Hypsibius exemplaris]|uniref:Bulb-type lectin domain-containing protein n=1 Tax=Hypsibius exemplaris TaxID=2072580 RepID=A0A1W0X2F5_HYPEX|nr:hypothetical protein BV898_04452 [Hypsibius exemplaris]
MTIFLGRASKERVTQTPDFQFRCYHGDAALPGAGCPSFTTTAPATTNLDLNCKKELLPGGRTLYSRNCEVHLQMEPDGDLVFRCTSGKVLWRMNTKGTGKMVIMTRSTGYLVVLDSSGQDIWISKKVNSFTEALDGRVPSTV